MVAMITSNMSRANHPSRISLALDSAEGREARILMDSVIMTDNVATVRENEIDRRLGNLKDLTKVDAALRRTLSL
jgi:mRNA interferase MazF